MKHISAAVAVLVSLPLGAADTPGWLTDTAEWIKKLSQSEIKITVPSQAEWQTFWTSITSSLNSDSIDTLAAIKPQAESALVYLDQFDSTKKYADWLRQRLDFIEVADEIAREEKRLQPPAQPSRLAKTNAVTRIQPSRPDLPVQPAIPVPSVPLPEKPVSIVPPAFQPVPKPSPAMIAKTERMSRSARSSAIWKRRISQRAAPANARELVPKLKKIFREEGVPEQLVWLGEVESTMDPDARNPSGAAGLFQMMAATARRFGLRVSPPPDERFDAEKQARAAAKYLSYLQRQFKNWPLALAAYNAGEGRIGKALKESGGKTFDDIAPSLSVETQMYVPKIDAVLQHREGIGLARLPSA